MDHARQRHHDRIAGSALILAGLGIPAAMVVHPTSPTSGLIEPVHGLLIALLFVSAAAFVHQAIRRDMKRWHISTGVVLMSGWMFANALAAVINGFVLPRLAARGAIEPSLAAALWETNQSLAQISVIALGGAILLWSLAWVHHSGKLAKAIVLGGILAGAAPAALLLTGTIGMDVHGALFAYGAQALWGLLLGLAMCRGDLDRMDEATGASELGWPPHGQTA